MHFAAFSGISSPARKHRLVRAGLRRRPCDHCRPRVSTFPIACNRGSCIPVPSGLQPGRAMNAACKEHVPTRPGSGVASVSPELPGRAGALSACWSDGEADLSSARFPGPCLWAQMSFGKSGSHRDQAQLVPGALRAIDGAVSEHALRARTILGVRRRTGTVQRPAPDRQKRKRCRGRESPRRHAG